HLVVQAGSGARGVAEDDRPLQQGSVGRIDGAVRQRTEAGRDPIDHRALAIEAVDDLARREHPRPHPGIEGHGLVPPGRAHHGVDGERAAVDCDHSASSLLDHGGVLRESWPANPWRAHVRYVSVESLPAPPLPPSTDAWPPPPPAPPAWPQAAGYPPRGWPVVLLAISCVLVAAAGVTVGAATGTSSSSSTAARLAAAGRYASAVAIDEAIAARGGPLYALTAGASGAAETAAEETVLGGAAALGRRGKGDEAGGLTPAGRAADAVVLLDAVLKESSTLASATAISLLPTALLDAGEQALPNGSYHEALIDLDRGAPS